MEWCHHLDWGGHSLSSCIFLIKSWFMFQGEKNTSPHLSVCKKELSSSLSTLHHLLCSLFLLMVSPSYFAIQAQNLPVIASLSLLCPIPNLSVVNFFFLLSLMSVPSSIPIAAALIWVLIVSCQDYNNNIANGLSASLKSVSHIGLICLQLKSSCPNLTETFQ